MFSHMHSATIAVRDQDAALDFYTNTLGWAKAIDAPLGPDMRWLTVVPPGATTQLVLAHVSMFGPDHTIGGNTGIALIAPDIDALYATLTARGVAFKQPVEVMPWGAKATWFADPDGNEFFVVSE